MNFYQRIIKSEALKHFMNNSVLMNWNDLNKSILMLLLGGVAHILWIIWYVVLSRSESFHMIFNHDYGVFHLNRMILFCAISFALILPIHFGRHIQFIQHYFPCIAVFFFAMSFLYGGYTVGIISPVAIAGYISLITVGLVLFERKMMYPVFIPISVYLLVAILMTLHHKLPYAPIYTAEFNQTVFHRSEFWVYTQMYFYIPIFFAALVLFEVLLTQWRNREKKVNEMSQIDPLTGVFNRRKIAENLNDIQKSDQGVAIILLDLDHFKSINDTYGHDIGDMVLTKVAQTLNQNVRGGDLVGRFGGEEFIIVLQNKPLKTVIEIAERCRSEIEKLVIKINQTTNIHVSASFGVSTTDHFMSKELILKQADDALYFAKKSGRNQVKQFKEFEQNKVETQKNTIYV